MSTTTRGTTTAATELTAAEAVRAVEADGPRRLVDVRTAVEHRGEHVAGATHVPLDELDRRVDELRALGGTPDGPLLLLCKKGPRAEQARRTLEGHGLTDARVVAGGIDAWCAAGGPTVRGQAGMSLERQVRIAAGSLGLTGVVLGFLVHPGFFFLSGFISAGLIFAGITDWCGMGMLLARMPWNRR